MRKESFQGILLGIVIMCAVFAFITVAWAAFSQTLTIGGTASISAQNWYVGFSDRSNNTITTPGPVYLTPTTGGNATAPSANTVILTETSFGRTTGQTPTDIALGTLSNVGDSLTYSWYIVNNGTFDATLSEINPALVNDKIPLKCTSSVSSENEKRTTTEPNDTDSIADVFCAGITATIKINDSVPTTSTVIAKKGASMTVLPVEFELEYTTAPANVSDLPSGTITVSLGNSGQGLSFIFQQATGNGN